MTQNPWPRYVLITKIGKDKITNGQKHALFLGSQNQNTKMKLVSPTLVIQFFITFCFSQELETSNQIIVKEDETAVLWCRFSDNKP